MPKYDVVLVYAATKLVKVEATSKEEAEEKAQVQSHASLCHHCSRHLELGDVYEVHVERASS